MVSVIVITYNPVWHKLKSTLKSILIQEKVLFEIIVADDGSKDNCFEKIKNYFDEYNFKNYLLLKSSNNQGTCKNSFIAINKSKYSYIKLISPGDFFYDKYTLFNWYQYMINKDAQICFTKAAYYNQNHGNINILRVMQNPTNVNVYKNGNLNEQKQSFLLLPDAVLGAALLVKKNIITKYMDMIVDKVKYCEDYFIKLFLLNNNSLTYYDKVGIWYEYGEGISTNIKWRNLVTLDKKACAKIMLLHLQMEDRWNIRWKMIWKYKERYGNLPRWRYMLFPRLIFLKLKKMTNPQWSDTNLDINLLKSIVE